MSAKLRRGNPKTMLTWPRMGWPAALASQVVWFVLLTLMFGSGLVVPAQEKTPAQPPKLTREQEAWLTQRKNLWNEAEKLAATNRKQALVRLQSVLDKDRQILGPKHRETGHTVKRISDLAWKDGQEKLALAFADEHMQILAESVGKDDWRTRDAFWRREQLARLMNASREDRRREEQAVVLFEQARANFRSGKYEDAAAQMKVVVKAYSAVYGEDTPPVAYVLQHIGKVFSGRYEYADAEQLTEQAAAISRQWFGPASPSYSDGLKDRALLALERGHIAAMETLATQALLAAKQAAECPADILGNAESICGQAALQLRSTARARDHFERALDLYLAAFGENSLTVIHTKRRLGTCSIREGKIDEATQLFAELEAQLRKVHPQAKLELITLLEEVASANFHARRYQVSRDTYARALTELKAEKLGESPRAAGVLEGQAQCEERLDRVPQAFELIHQALELFRQTAGTQYSRTRSAALEASRIGWTYLLQKLATGDIAAARAIAQRDLLSSQAILGDGHEQTPLARLRVAYVNKFEQLAAPDRQRLLGAIDLFKQGTALYNDKKHEAAITTLEECAATYQALANSNEPLYADCLVKLAYAYIAAKQSDKAEALYRQAETILVGAYGAANPPLLLAHVNFGLAKLCQTKKQYTEAIVRYRQAQANYRRLVGDNSEAAFQVTEQLAEVLFATNEYESAAAAFRELLAILERTVGKEDLRYAINSNKLGNSYLRLTKYGEAEKWFLQALALLEKLNKTELKEYGYVEENLGLTYQKLGVYDKAIVFLERSLKSAKLLADAPRIARCQASLGAIWGQQGKFAEAEASLAQAITFYESRKATYGNELADRQNDLERIWLVQAAAMELTHQFPAALTFRKKILEQRQRRFSADTYLVKGPAEELKLTERLSQLSEAQLDEYDAVVQATAKLKSQLNGPQALEQAQAAVDKCRSLIGQKNYRYLDALKLTAEIHLFQGSLKDCLNVCDELRLLIEELFGDSARLADCLSLIASAQTSLGQMQEAVVTRRKVVAIYEGLRKQNMPIGASLALAQSRLGDTLLTANDFAGGSEAILGARSYFQARRREYPAEYQENLGHVVDLETLTQLDFRSFPITGKWLIFALDEVRGLDHGGSCDGQTTVDG